MNLLNMTIGRLFSERVQKSPDRLALVFEDEKYTWKELDIHSDNTALLLLDKGVKKGTHVGIWSTNTPNWIIYFMALSKIGAVPVLFNVQLKRLEITEMLSYTDISCLCYGDGYRDSKFGEMIGQIGLEKLPKLELLINIGRGCNGHFKKPLPPPISTEEKEKLEDYKALVNPQDVLSILFTSGTTSASKGVMLSHFASANIAMEAARQMRWSEEDRICVSIPLFHCFGLSTCLLAGIYSGCTIYLLEYYRTINVLECADHNRCTVLNGVPTMFLAMIRNPMRKKYNLKSLKSGIIAGSHVNKTDYLNICRDLGMSRLQMSYGQTEASPSISFSDYYDSMEKKSESVGKVIPDVELKIASLTTGESLGIGEEGEILTRGYNTMLGYYNMPEETKKAVDEDGWLHTGDIGFVDEDGCLHISGRKKEMIIRSGENISPLEIENHIKGFPGVYQVKVIGIPAEVTQEEIAACIIEKEGEKVTGQKLRNYLMERLADHKVPRYIVCMDRFPVNMSGKIILNELKDKAISILGESLNMQ